MRKSILFGAALALLLGAGCTKEVLPENLSTPVPAASSFIRYVIPQGAHYANGNDYKATDFAVLKFTVRFDSSCIYKTLAPENQWDINKLYGFADNNALHHQFSARFGWRWSEGALRLFAYTYNNGERSSKELGTIPIGKDVKCAIVVKGEQYVFSVNDKEVAIPRHSTSATARGYQLYPYFGGDETAPHEVRIWIREEKQ
jgi:hypothetical protein